VPGSALTRAATVALLAACVLLGGLVGAASARRTAIGHSVKGRPIVALERGDDATAALRVLVVGCIHGDETAGMRIARKLSAGRVPADAAFWIVPTLNPDGVAAGTRGNARGVDLNRNFPFAWRPLGGGEYSGPHALSEPESRAAEGLIERLRPDLTIWFHQPFDLVDRSGGDPGVERRFAQLSGLPLVRLRRYPGSATSWENHAFPGSTAFVAELPASVGDALVGRAAAAVRALAAELVSPGVGDAAPG